MAVHMKGVRLDVRGDLTVCGFSESIWDYQYIFSQLRKVPQQFNVLLEEINPIHAENDRRFMQKLLHPEEYPPFRLSSKAQSK